MDSALAVRLGTMLSQEAGGKPYTLAADSGMAQLLSAIPHNSGGNIIQLTQFSATVASRDVSDVRDSNFAKVTVDCEGTLLEEGKSILRKWNLFQVITLPTTPADLQLLETNKDRYVTLEREMPESVWARTIEPALVVAGAALIVALFFLIRTGIKI